MKLNSETKLLLAMGAFVMVGGGALILLNRVNNPSPDTPRPTPPPPPPMTQSAFDALVHNARYTEGSPDAPLTVVEFADFQCPSCRNAYNNVLVKYKILNPKNVRLIFYNMPLTTLHPRAMPAAIAAEAAGRQGKFWPMYNRLFSGQLPHLESADLDDDARKVGLDLDKFHQDELDGTIGSIIAGDQQAATTAGVNQTPTFFIEQAGSGNTPQSVIGVSGIQNILSEMYGPNVVPPYVVPSPGPSPAVASTPSPGAP